MEVFLFFAIVFVLWMIFGSSSEHDEAHSDHGEKPKHQNGYNYPLAPPNYPQWEHKPDWKDLEYEYYRVPRIYNYRSMLGVATRSAFATVWAVGILILLIYLYNRDGEKEKISQSDPLGQIQPGKSAIEKPEREEKQYKRDCAKSSINFDYTTLQKAKEVFPSIEFFYDSKDRKYFAVMYSDDIAALTRLVKNWREKYRKQFGFDFKYYDVSKLCGKDHQSIIIHGDAPYTWICKVCRK